MSSSNNNNNNNNSGIRCAACRYLRRRCPKECIFGPYFPSNNLERFASVHKIFGASNVAKILKELPEGKRKEAVESLVLEARARIRDPVYGSVGTIAQLRQQIMEAEYELAKTQGLIALFHAQYMHEYQRNLEAQSGTLTAQIVDYNLDFDQPLSLIPQEQQQLNTSFVDLTDEAFYTSIY